MAGSRQPTVLAGRERPALRKRAFLLRGNSTRKCSGRGRSSGFKSELQKFYVWNFSSSPSVNIDQGSLFDTGVKNCRVRGKSFHLVIQLVDPVAVIYSFSSSPSAMSTRGGLALFRDEEERELENTAPAAARGGHERAVLSGALQVLTFPVVRRQQAQRGLATCSKPYRWGFSTGPRSCSAHPTPVSHPLPYHHLGRGMGGGKGSKMGI